MLHTQGRVRNSAGPGIFLDLLPLEVILENQWLVQGSERNSRGNFFFKGRVLGGSSQVW